MQFVGELTKVTVLEIDDEAVLELHGQNGAIRIHIPEVKGPALVHIAEDCRRVYDASLVTDGGNEARWHCPHCARNSRQRRSV